MLAEEGLRPIDAKSVSDAFLIPPESRKVGRDSLFSYAGMSFSAPPHYIGKNVQIEASDGRIRAYFEGGRSPSTSCRAAESTGTPPITGRRLRPGRCATPQIPRSRRPRSGTWPPTTR